VVTGSGSRRRAAPAVPSDAWQLLGSGGPTWQGDGRTAEAARAVGGGWGDAWMGGAALQKLRKRPAAAVARAQRNRGDRGPEEDDGGSKRKFREKEGPFCKTKITFQPVLKWRWVQKQKCIVFQNVQLCFKVHP
jgi:hypothetical protein